MIINENYEIQQYLKDFYRYKKSNDIESVYIMLYLRENKKILNHINLIDDSYVIEENDFIELKLAEYDEIGYKFTYIENEKLIDKSLVILEKLKSLEKTCNKPIYLRLNIEELEKLVNENESFIVVVEDEEIEGIEQEYFDNLKQREQIKNKINQLLDNYSENNNKYLYELVIEQKILERSRLELLRQGELLHLRKGSEVFE